MQKSFTRTTGLLLMGLLGVLLAGSGATPATSARAASPGERERARAPVGRLRPVARPPAPPRQRDDSAARRRVTRAQGASRARRAQSRRQRPPRGRRARRSAPRPGPAPAPGIVGAGAHATAAARAAARRVRARYAFFEGGRRMWGHGVGRKIVLTFDDGPYYQTTPRLLDHLDAFGVKAAFFVNSRNFDPDGLITGKSYKVLEEIHRRGHLLGNHTHSHPVLPSLTAEKQRKQIRLADRAIERITGAPSTLFRPPYGKLSPFAAKLLKKQGSTVVMWNLGSDDDKDFNVSKVVNNLMRKLERQGGGIILLHDTHYWSIEAVPSLLRAIRVESCKQLAAGEEPYEVTGLQYFHRPRQGARRTSPQDHRAWLQRRAALKRLCQTPAQAPVPAFIRGE